MNSSNPFLSIRIVKSSENGNDMSVETVGEQLVSAESNLDSSIMDTSHQEGETNYEDRSKVHDLDVNLASEPTENLTNAVENILGGAMDVDS